MIIAVFDNVAVNTVETALFIVYVTIINQTLVDAINSQL